MVMMNVAPAHRLLMWVLLSSAVDRKAGSIGRIKLIEVVKVAKPKSRNDENIYQNH